MRAKELKQYLSKIPDDTEILLRCQVHERPHMGAKEIVTLASITPHISDSVHQIMFNPSKSLRLVSFQPDPTDLVACTDCIRCGRITTCQKRERYCEDCHANCECKNCGHYNITEPEPFSNRPQYERDHTKR